MKSQTLSGILLAVLATLLWSGNFIVARSESSAVPPVTLAFYRWSCAALILLPLLGKTAWRNRAILWQCRASIFWAALFGISLFNTFVYMAGHFSAAINLALIGTTSSPIFSLILARIFLREHLPWQRWVGLSVCITGILLLITKGNPANLVQLKLSAGDGWILLAALSFAVYNILTRKKPAGISPPAYLFATFWVGAIILLPFYLLEKNHSATVVWNWHLAGVVGYLSLGASVISFYCWNAALARLGAARTALFGNLIPLFSSLEAVWLLNEKLTWLHGTAMLLILSGLIIANLTTAKRPKPLAGAVV